MGRTDTPSSVDRHDVVIREEAYGGALRFIFYVGDTVAQVAWADEETALRHAIQFATVFKVSAWWKVGERDYMLLKAGRPKHDVAAPPVVHTVLLNRLRGQFLEMPGLSLTLVQAERLCGVEASVCKTVLDALVDARFLRTTHDGKYHRAADGA